MPLQPTQPIKLIGISCLIVLLYGCGASAPVQPVEIQQTPTESDTLATESPDGKPALAPAIQTAFNKGMQAINNKEYDKAIDIFFAMSRAYPELSGPYANLGMLLAAKKDYANAEAALKQALQLNPDNPEIYNHLGLLYRQTGRFDEALQIYSQGLEHSPENINLLRNTGILLELYFNNSTEALKHYQRYLELQPDDKQVQIWIADLNQRNTP